MHDALHNVTEAIDLANKVEQPEPTQVGLDGKRHIKALIITLTNSGEATAQARRLIKSIHETKSQINPLIMDASTPETANEGLASITYKDFRKHLGHGQIHLVTVLISEQDCTEERTRQTINVK